jgi:proteasome lid subunit RPN8/RPN11
MALHIGKVEAEAIQEEGRKAYPHECCGFLVGRADNGTHRVTHIWPANNEKESEEARRRYWISPEVTFQTEKRARTEGLDVLGIYHSHPDHPDRPSEFDRNHALPGWSYIVFSVTKGEPGPIRSWLLAGDRSVFHPEDVRIDGDPRGSEE